MKASQTELLLAENGRSSYAIIIAKNADIIEEFAANELQKYLKEISGVLIPIRKDGVRSGKAIFVGKICFKMEPRIKRETSSSDGYWLHTSGDSVFFRAQGRSVLYAVYHFLELLGCRWFYPVRSEQIVPRRRKVVIKALNRKIVYPLKLRGIDLKPITRLGLPLILEHIDWMGKNRFNMLCTHPGVYGTDFWSTDIARWDMVKDALLPELKKRGILLNMNVHNLFHFIPPEKYYRPHPRWFAVRGSGKIWGYPGSSQTEDKAADIVAGNLVRYFDDPVEMLYPYEVNEVQKTYPRWLSIERGQKIPSQICYANRQAVDQYKQNVITYVQEHPEVDMLGLWPSDGGNFCQCKTCKENPWLIFQVVNEIAAEVYKVNRRVSVEHIVYGERSREVPRRDMTLSPNLFVWCSGKRGWLDWLKRNAKRGYYRGDYKLADNYAASGCVRLLNLRYAAAEVADLTNNGFAGFHIFYIEITSWWRSGFNLHFYGKAATEGLLPLKKELADYCRSYYGKTADAVRGIMTLLLSEIKYTKPPGSAKPVSWYIAQVRQALKKLRLKIRTLVKRVENEPVLKDRLWKLDTYIDFTLNRTLADFLREAARREQKRGHLRKATAIMLEVAVLEDHLQQLCQESMYRADGVLDLRFFVGRRKWRFLKDKEVLEDIQKRLVKH